MQIGLVGSGNMARALALAWGEPVLCTDSGSGRARELAALVGGEAVGSNRELAERADVVVLAHKPAQLDAAPREIAGTAKVVVSILARTSQAEVRAAYPETPVFRIEPNTPVEVRRGVLAFAIPDTPFDQELATRVRELFGRLGTVVDVPEPLMRIAGATGGVGPAVTSPGGTTARGLAALERGGVRAALAQAMDDVVDFT